MRPNTPDKVWLKVRKGRADECWPWTGHVDHEGYGLMRLNMRMVRVHRLAYETTIGPILTGLVLDHLCRNRLCCNPGHLDPVTIGENVRRGGNAIKTHCRAGHRFDDTNTRLKADGSRNCRACDRLRDHARSQHKTPATPAA